MSNDACIEVSHKNSKRSAKSLPYNNYELCIMNYELFLIYNQRLLLPVRFQSVARLDADV